jgi:hypothetical protein
MRSGILLGETLSRNGTSTVFKPEAKETAKAWSNLSKSMKATTGDDTSALFNSGGVVQAPSVLSMAIKIRA